MQLEQNHHEERRGMGGDSLFLLESLIFQAGLVVLNTDDDLDSFLWGQEPSVGRRVGEEKPENYRGDEGEDTSDGK